MKNNKEFKFEYSHEESTVDVRHWNVCTNRPLTDEQVQDICNDYGFEDTYPTDNGSIKVTYNGTEYGDDAEISTYKIKG